MASKTTKVHVSGLPSDTVERDLVNHFSKMGRLAIHPKTQQPLVHIPKNKDGSIKGEAFVIYEDAEAAESALELLNNKPVSSSLFSCLLDEILLYHSPQHAITNSKCCCNLLGLNCVDVNV